MKLILDRPVTDRVDGKAIVYKTGQAVDFPKAMAEELVRKGAGHSFAKTVEESEALKEAVEHPAPTPAVPVQTKK
jgi:hypothetical protein